MEVFSRKSSRNNNQANKSSSMGADTNGIKEIHWNGGMVEQSSPRRHSGEQGNSAQTIALVEEAQALVGAILGDKSVELTRKSCAKAVIQYSTQQAEWKKKEAKLTKAKDQRDAMAEPLKQLTEQLQAASKERKELHKKSAALDKEIHRLKQELERNQETAQNFKEEKNALQLQVTALIRQNSFRHKEDASVATMSFADGASTFISAITNDYLPIEYGENENSLNILDDIEGFNDPVYEKTLEAPMPEDSNEPSGSGARVRQLEIQLVQSEEQIDILRAELDGSKLSVKERERKLEILEEYLMDEAGVKNTVSYLTVELTFYATSILPDAEELMTDILMKLRLEGTKVGINIWNNYMKFWASSGLPEAPEKMENLVECMRKECVEPNIGTWNQFMTFWALSGSPKAHDKMEVLLQGMADDSIQPNVDTWNIYAKTPGKK
jgi:hypothetical protein